MGTLVNNPVNPFPVDFDFADVQDDEQRLLDQREALGEDLDVNQFILDWVQPHIGGKFDIAASLTDGYIERTVEGASTLSLTVEDPYMALLQSGVLFEKPGGNLASIDVNLNSLWFSLSDVNKNGTQVTLTFEDQVIAEMRKFNSFRKASRAKMTRAEFIRMLLREIKRIPVRMYSPELRIKQKIQPLSKNDAEKVRKTQRGPGFGPHIKLEVTGIPNRNGPLNKTQIKNLQAVLDEAEHLSCNDHLMTAVVMCVMQESMAKTTATAGTHVGLFQQDSSRGSVWVTSGGATRDPHKDAHAFIIPLKQSYKLKPNQGLADLIESVQVSGHPELYKPWEAFAKKVVREYGAHPSNITRYAHYEYMRGINGQKENTWDCALRLAQEVQWRFFVVSGTVYYVSEYQLFRSAPRALIKAGVDGVDDIDFDVSANKKISECTVTARASRWAIPPGTVVTVDDSFGPAAGNWLVSTIHRSLFDRTAEITLRKPMHAKLEPAAGVVNEPQDSKGVVYTGQRLRGGDVRARIVAAAVKAHKHIRSYHYSHARGGAGYPAGSWPGLYSKTVFAAGMDCSAFATMCYREAGAKDPNGLNYNGTGYTGTLQKNGRPTTQPQPGDLVFYGPGQAAGGAPGHVAVYIGKVSGVPTVIEMGGTPGPNQLPVHYRSDFIGYYRYDMGAPVHEKQRRSTRQKFPSRF